MSDEGERTGQQIGNYQLTHLLGRGNFADVYLGQHVHLHTLAAIKVLHGRLTDDDLANFSNEARVIAHLRHPHIVQVLDFGVDGATPFLVMDFAPNGNLRQRHPKGSRLPLQIVLSYVRQVADALQFAHEQHLIHRDIKPENMLLGRNNVVLLSDFGIALMYPSASSWQTQDTAGTVPYMSPEQLQAHPVPASDQYALGIVTYEWLCGERPFNGTLPEIAIKHSLAPPPSLRERVTTVSPAVEQVIAKALAKNPRQRFERIQDFAQALEEATKTASPHWTLPSKTPDAYYSNLPAPLTPLIGREQEVLAVCALLQRQDVRLVTFTGTGGIGKTRLSLEVASELLRAFSDGVYFIPLASIVDPALVIPTIAHELGMTHRYAERQQPVAEHMDYLKTTLREKRCLLLLDNFEQVVSAAPDMAELLAACPHLKMLVTSRAVLYLQGEHAFPVPPLALPEGTSPLPVKDLTQYPAIALFLQRALAIKPDFDVTTANVQTIVAICRRLDGLPLAIELAAARIKLLPLEALLQRMIRPLAILTGGMQNAPERQLTLRNTIAWSYHLLNAVDQQLFRRISVFVGGCTLDAIEALYISYPDRTELVLDGVTSLIDKSLLQQTGQGDEPRLVMLETIREYALEMLSANGEEQMARYAHAAYYLSLAEESERELGGPNQAIWLERLEREHDNLRAAMEWSLKRGENAAEAERHVELALRLGGALRRFWQMHGHLNEGHIFLERALLASKGIEISTRARAKALIAAGTLASTQNDFDRTETYCRQSLALFRELGDQQGIALSLYLLSIVPLMKGDSVAARSLTQEALELFREMGDRERIAWSLSTLGIMDAQVGKYDSARLHYEESLAVHRELGDERGIAITLLRLAQLLFVSQGDQEVLRSLLDEGLALFTELGEKEGIANCYSLSGELALSQGDSAAARLQIETSITLYREIGHRRALAESFAVLARIVSAQGERAAARSIYEESLAIARELKHTPLIASCLEGLADVVSSQGQFRWAAQLLGAAESLREAIGIPIALIDRANYERQVAAVRGSLDEHDFAALWSEGRATTPEQALAAQGRSRSPASITAATIPSPTYPAGLTAREVQVLRLLAGGLTNREIARELSLSEKTVAHHLTHIFNKTNSENRAAATAFAIRQGLV
ncbi:MAG: tetratricopeptide repeat protein [Chloroflexi bacterium]|nr:MAG: tetratricopeptide repeat protein [Chloroflexota bacterium]